MVSLFTWLSNKVRDIENHIKKMKCVSGEDVSLS